MESPVRLRPGLDYGSGHIVASHRPGAYDIGCPAWRVFHQGRNGSGLLRIEEESGERGAHSGRIVRSCASRPDHSAADAVPSDSAYRLRGDCPALCEAGRIDYTDRTSVV